MCWDGTGELCFVPFFVIKLPFPFPQMEKLYCRYGFFLPCWPLNTYFSYKGNIRKCLQEKMQTIQKNKKEESKSIQKFLLTQNKKLLTFWYTSALPSSGCLSLPPFLLSFHPFIHPSNHLSICPSSHSFIQIELRFYINGITCFFGSNIYPEQFTNINLHSTLLAGFTVIFVKKKILKKN